MCEVSNCDGRARNIVLETETNPRRIIYATDFPRHPNCAECAGGRPLSANRCSVAWANSLQYGFSGPRSVLLKRADLH